MEQKIVNKPDITTIGGSYIGGNIYYNEQQKDGIDKINSIKTIFLSYNWHDSGIADRIDRHLSRLSDVIVKRDVRDIGSWKSIRKFMKSIRQQDYAVLIVSDLYLRSKNCMFEVTEIMKEPEYENRIFPAVVEHGIYNPLVRAGY